jgi:hypothetical protein
MSGLVDANLPAEHTQRGRQVHSIRDPNFQRPSPNSPVNGLHRRSSRHRAPHSALPTLGSESESETEPPSSGDEPSSSDHSSNAQTLIVSPSDDDTEVQSSLQSSEEGGQIIASRTRYRLAHQRTITTALQTELSPSQQNPLTPITHTGPNDTLLTPQITNDNSLTGLQDRQRLSFKHSRHCLENHTRTDLFTSETPDEEVDHGTFGIDANPHIDSDQKNDGQGKVTRVYR